MELLCWLDIKTMKKIRDLSMILNQSSGSERSSYALLSARNFLVFRDRKNYWTFCQFRKLSNYRVSVSFRLTWTLYYCWALYFSLPWLFWLTLGNPGAVKAQASPSLLEFTFTILHPSVSLQMSRLKKRQNNFAFYLIIFRPAWDVNRSTSLLFFKFHFHLIW